MLGLLSVGLLALALHLNRKEATAHEEVIREAAEAALAAKAREAEILAAPARSKQQFVDILHRQLADRE